MFGFTGYVLLPQVIISRACDFIDRGFRPTECINNPTLCSQWLSSFIEADVKSHPNLKKEDFSIFYAIRIGEGMPPKSKFYLYQFNWVSKLSKLEIVNIEIPLVSSILKLDGSGFNSLWRWSSYWEKSEQGNTSRTMFSGFCDSINSGEDKLSGGEPQLIGIHRQDKSKVFGVVTKNGSSIQGVFLDVDTAINMRNIEWRDTLFQRVKGDGSLMKNAQRHARPKLIIDNV